MELKTKPLAHQAKIYKETKDLARYALFWEMGVGKTKPTIDTASLQFTKGKIDALVVIAPDGVERNWINDEIPKHMPDEVRKKSICMYWNTKKANTKSYQKELKEILEHKGLVVFAFAYSSTITNKGKPFLYKLLEKRKCFYVLDEATHIANPSAKRSKTIHATAKYAPWRRVLTGTPIRNGPFDAYSIMKFLDLGFWKKYELDSFTMFKYYFGKFERRKYGDNPAFDYLIEYQRLDELNKILDQHSSRLLKDDVLDLPPKIYNKRYFDITPKQRALYDEIKTDFMAFLDGEMITAPLAITRLIRFQQIVCGYIPVDDGEEPMREIEKENPRLKVMEDLAKEIPHQAIIWAKFTRDIDKLIELLGPKNCGRYDGKVNSDDREKAKNDFQSGKIKWFVAKPQAAGEGLTLTAARTVVYYNMTYKLVERLQSEDRPHRHGQRYPVNYWDIIASNTVDENIIDAQREKKDLANIILGDEFKEWL